MVATFLFGGLSMLPLERAQAAQPKATLQLQDQSSMPVININKATAEELDATNFKIVPRSLSQRAELEAVSHE